MPVTINGRGQVPVRIVQTVKTDTFSTSSTSLVDVTGLSVNITPTSASNRIFVMYQITGGSSNLMYSGLTRNSTVIYKGDNASNRVGTSAGCLGFSDQVQAASLIFLDSPATTSAVTYTVQVRVQSGTCYINRSASDPDSFSAGQRTVSSITVMEISG
jgi:hypothetical protein